MCLEGICCKTNVGHIHSYWPTAVDLPTGALTAEGEILLKQLLT